MIISRGVAMRRRRLYGDAMTNRGQDGGRKSIGMVSRWRFREEHRDVIKADSRLCRTKDKDEARNERIRLYTMRASLGLNLFTGKPEH